MSTAQFFIGVDGGATRCRARIRAASGRALAEDTGPAANIYVDFDAGLAVMRKLVASVIAKAGLAGVNRGKMALGVGLAEAQYDLSWRRAGITCHRSFIWPRHLMPSRRNFRNHRLLAVVNSASSRS